MEAINPHGCVLMAFFHKTKKLEMKRSLTLLLIFCFISGYPQGKISAELAHFKNSDFMQKFNDLRLMAEITATDIINDQENYSKREFRKIQFAYRKMSFRANSLLEQLKFDFLHKKIGNRNNKNRNRAYVDTITSHLKEIHNIYQYEFEPAVLAAEEVDEEVFGSGAIPMMLFELAEVAASITKFFIKRKKENRRYKENYLNYHLVRPFKWKSWNQLAGLAETDYWEKPSKDNINANSASSYEEIKDNIRNYHDRYQELKKEKKEDEFFEDDETDIEDWDYRPLKLEEVEQ